MSTGQQQQLSIPARNKLIRQLYVDGASLREVADRFGISKQHVGRVLAVHDVKRRPRGRPTTRK